MSMPPSTHDLIRYESLINGLRVNELQSLLTHFKSPKLGKKQDLINRAIGLLRAPQHQCELIRQIDEMNRRVARPAPYPTPASRGYGNPPMNGVMFGAGGGATMYGAQQQHNNNQAMGGRVVRGLRPLPLPFYDSIDTVQEPIELAAVPSGIKTQQRQVVLFAVPTVRKPMVYYRSEEKALPRYELQLRFFHLAGEWIHQELPDDFPLNVNVRIDDQVVMLPNIIPTNKPNVEPKRPSRPVNITPYCQPPRDTMARPHRLTVEWTGDKRSWSLGIYLVHRVTSDILKDRAVKNDIHKQPLELTKQTIIRRLGTGDDDGITMDQLKISLLCPLGKTRMELPARCRDCTHLQCFDLDLYLKMNEKRPTWKCAVCSGNAPYHRLIIDGYFQAMLRDVDRNTTEVELLRDGSYQTIKEEIYDLSDDDGLPGGVDHHSRSVSKSNEQSATTSATNSVSGAGGKKPHNPADDDIIVLDSDDDEDMQRAVEASTCSAAAGSVLQQRNSSSASSSTAPPSASYATPPRRGGSVSEKGDKGDESVIVIDDDTPPRDDGHSSRVTAAVSSAASSVATTTAGRVAMVAPQVRMVTSSAPAPTAHQAPAPTASMNAQQNHAHAYHAHVTQAQQQYMQQAALQQAQVGMMPQFYQWRGQMNGGGAARSPNHTGGAGPGQGVGPAGAAGGMSAAQYQQLLGRHTFGVPPAFQYGAPNAAASNGGGGYPPNSNGNGVPNGNGQPVSAATHGGMNLAQVLQTLQQSQHHQQQPGGGYPNYHNGQ